MLHVGFYPRFFMFSAHKSSLSCIFSVHWKVENHFISTFPSVLAQLGPQGGTSNGKSFP